MARATSRSYVMDEVVSTWWFLDAALARRHTGQMIDGFATSRDSECFGSPFPNTCTSVRNHAYVLL
jgi:hypothetical protein